MRQASEGDGAAPASADGRVHAGLRSLGGSRGAHGNAQRGTRRSIVVSLLSLAIPVAAYALPGLPPDPVDWSSVTQIPSPAPAALLGVDEPPAESREHPDRETRKRRKGERTQARRKPRSAREARPVPRGPWSADWEAIAMCESSRRWSLNIGRFDGGLQFLPSTWDMFGGREFAPYAWQASPVEQMVVAERVLDGQGPGAWPVCFAWGT